jgi:hypothetical protein
MRLGTSRRRSSATAGDVTAACVRWSTEPAILLAPCRRSAAIVDACKRIGIRRHESPPAGRPSSPLTAPPPLSRQLSCDGLERREISGDVPCGIWDCFILRVRVPRSPALGHTNKGSGWGGFLSSRQGAVRGRSFVFSRTAGPDLAPWATVYDTHSV